ncbi:hypothetical protein [Mycolicibacterium sp. HS_4_1]
METMAENSDDWPTERTAPGTVPSKYRSTITQPATPGVLLTAVVEPAGVIRALARGIKQGIGVDDLPPSLFLWRDGSPFGWISGPTSQAVLSAGVLSIKAHDPQCVVFVLDSVVPLATNNPETGRPWQSGEALAYLEELDPGERAEQDFARDCLSMCVTTPDGDQSALLDLYKMVGGECYWTGEESQFAARMTIPVLSDAMRGPRVDPAQVRDPGSGFVAAPDAPFMPAERGRLILDVGTTRHVETKFLEHGVSMVLFAASDEQREFLVSEGLPEWQILSLL